MQTSSTNLATATGADERGGPSPHEVGAPLAALDRLLGKSDEASAARHPSITALAAEWQAAWNESEAAFQRLAAAEHTAAASYPDFPASCTGRDATGRTGHLSRDEIERMGRLGLVSTTDLWARRLEAYDRWAAECEAIDARLGVPALFEAFNRSSFHAQHLADRVLEMTPQTPTELALKFAVLLKRCEDGAGGIDEAGPVFRFMEDLERLAGGF